MKSWFPPNTLRILRKARINYFSEVSARRAELQGVGLSDITLNELERLSVWLDIPWIDYEAACLLKRAGVNTPEEYYHLTEQAQRALEPTIPFGSIQFRSLPPVITDPHTPCFDLEPHLQPLRRADGQSIGFGLRGPAIDWRWEGNKAVAHDITNRPWWGVPDRPVTDPSDPKYLEQKHWYPDPKLGWDVLGYQFGGATGGSLGYLLVYHRYSCTLRLFVYIPATNEGSYNQLLAHIFLTDRDDRQLGAWTFPLLDQPPPGIPGITDPDIAFTNTQNSPKIGGGSEGPPPVPAQGSPLTATFAWNNSGGPYDNLDPGSSQGTGR